jgi:hypothetical protein
MTKMTTRMDEMMPSLAIVALFDDRTDNCQFLSGRKEMVYKWIYAVLLEVVALES